jgi:hypothetical protein
LSIASRFPPLHAFSISVISPRLDSASSIWEISVVGEAIELLRNDRTRRLIKSKKLQLQTVAVFLLNNRKKV